MRSKLNIAVAFTIILAICNAVIFAGEVWSLGREDNSYREFALAGNTSNFLKAFPKDPVITIGNVNIDKEVPWILPGTHDAWAGALDHKVTINFDLDEQYSNDDVEFLEVWVSGLAHRSRAPILVLNLNGIERSVQTKPSDASDEVLRDPGKGTYSKYRVVFLKKDLKKSGNRLTITNFNGAWFLFDAIWCNSGTGKIETLALTSPQTVLRGENGQSPAREIFLDFNGRVLTKPTSLTIKLKQQGNEAVTRDFLLEPEKYLLGGPVIVPIKDIDASAEIQASLQLPNDEHVTASLTMPPVKHWEVHLLHQTHLDIGYTDTQVNILEKQVQNIRDALQYIEETKNYPEEARFKFHPEGMWAVEEFFRRATDDEKEQFVSAARERNLFLDGMFAQAMTGMYNDEELLHVMTAASKFAQEHNILIDSAMITDVPGWTWGYVPALAQHGIKYLNMGPNPGYCGATYDMSDKLFYWETPSGKERVLCLILSSGYNQFCGSSRGMSLDVSGIILKNLERFEANHYPYDIAILRYAIEGDNGRPNRVVSDSVRDWNEKYLWPKLILSRNSDAMQAMENRYRDKIETVRGDFTPYWEDGSASTAEATALNRAACEQLLQAETLWAMLRPNDFPAKDFATAWTDAVMYDEHTWGAHNSTTDPDSPFVAQQDQFKQNYARRANNAARQLLGDAGKKIVEKDGAAYAVFNTLSWSRTGFVTLPCNGKPGTADFFVREKNDNVSVSGQYLSEGGCVVPISAIPAVSSVLLTTSLTTNSETKDSVTINSVAPRVPFLVDESNATFSNGKITFVVDRRTGAIRSLKSKEVDGELVKPDDDGNVGLNDYLYIIGRAPKRERNRYDDGVKISVEDIGPWVLTVRVESPVPNCKSLIRKYRLYADANYLEMINILDKIKERRPEGTFFGFSFDVSNPVWRYDIPWVVAQVEKDQLPAANRDFYCVQRFCNVANAEQNIDWVTLDANMVQFPPIFDGYSWRRHIEPKGTLYSWVCNNHWETNYKADQEGTLTFRYVVRPNQGAFDAANSQRFGREIHQPPIVFPVDSKTSTVTSLFELSNTNIVATAVRPAEKKDALIIRLFNPTPEPQTTLLDVSETRRSFFSNTLEQRLEDAPKSLNFFPWEIKTIRIE